MKLADCTERAIAEAFAFMNNKQLAYCWSNGLWFNKEGGKEGGNYWRNASRNREELQGLVGIERLLVQAAAAGVRPAARSQAVNRNADVAPTCQSVRPGHGDVVVEAAAAVQHDDGGENGPRRRAGQGRPAMASGPR